MEDRNRPVTGYPAANPNPNPNGYSANPPPSGAAYPYPAAAGNPNPNGYSANPPPSGTAYPYAAAPPPPSSYFSYQNNNPYHHQDPNTFRRPTFLRRVLAVVIGLVVIFATITFIVWLVLRPQIPEFRVDSFSVSNFTVGENSLLSFAAEVRLTARNPNKKMTLSYDDIQAMVYYKSWLLSDTMIAPFSQGTKNETSLAANFAAAGSFIDRPAVDGINDERRNRGSVGFNLRMFSRVRFKAKAWRTRRSYLKVFCWDLMVGIPTNGSSGRLTGGPKQCRVGI